MVFLTIFAYFLLCDFFPLYEMKSDSCVIAAYSDNTAESESISDSKIVASAAIPYGLQKRDHLAIEEYILLVWVSTLLCEELRQVN